MSHRRSVLAVSLLMMLGVPGSLPAPEQGEVVSLESLLQEHPDLVRSFADGADPDTLFLPDGRSLSALLRGLPADPPKDLVYTPLPPCLAVRTANSVEGRLGAGEIRDFLARPEAIDLSSQGGSTTGCGVPATAEALAVVVRSAAPSGNGALEGRAFGPGPFQTLVEISQKLVPPRVLNATILEVCVPQSSCAADFSFRATTSTQVVVQVVGYFAPPSVLEADLLDGLDSTQFLRSDASTDFSGGTLEVGAGAALDIDGALDASGASSLSLPSAGIAGAGSGSGLDADRLDGLDSMALVRKSGDEMTGTLTIKPGPAPALDLSGHVFKDGGLFISTASNNTSLGLDALASLTSGNFNIAIGRNALFSNTTGSFNTAVGYRALRDGSASFNTAVGFRSLERNAGSVNTAVGYGALYLNDTGSRNTAIGSECLKSNTTGRYNTAAGVYALATNTTGSHNTAVGFKALISSNADLNTAVGYRALEYNSGGSYNTAAGAEALRENEGGGWNTALGDDALRSNLSGNLNTAVGQGALVSNTSGFRNTALGVAALSSNLVGSRNTAVSVYSLMGSTGDLNTAVGYKSLRNNGSGSNNVAVGYLALNANATGSRNIAIGYKAGSYPASGNDNIFMGNPGSGGDSGTIKIGTVGTHGAAFIAGIHNVTLAGSVRSVYVDEHGQLGTSTSSQRFKRDIRDLGEESRALLQLRPVSFRFKDDHRDGDNPVEFGLIAEEVAEILPELVVFDADGRPESVKYRLLSALLLGELQRVDREVRELRQLIVPARPPEEE